MTTNYYDPDTIPLLCCLYLEYGVKIRSESPGRVWVLPSSLGSPILPGPVSAWSVQVPSGAVRE